MYHTVGLLFETVWDILVYKINANLCLLLAPNMFYGSLANNHNFFACCKQSAFVFKKKFTLSPVDDKIHVASSKLTRLIRGPPEFPTYKITQKSHYDKSYNGF